MTPGQEPPSPHPGGRWDACGGSDRAGPAVHEWIAQAFTRVEDLVYGDLGVLLAGSAVALLVRAVRVFAEDLLKGAIGSGIIGLLDQLLLILMIVELLYTVQVSFRQHMLVPEPFVLVALISAIRRVLIITAEFSALMDRGERALRYAIDRARPAHRDDRRPGSVPCRAASADCRRGGGSGLAHRLRARERPAAACASLLPRSPNTS